MISFLRGSVAVVADGYAVLDVGGVGYEVRISGETAQRLAAVGDGEEVKVFTYLYLREDQIALYGFLSRDDLELFKLLITVSGIGPRGGLALLSTSTADDLRFAIMTGDAKMIARAPGIGKKTAERLILDLRDKISGQFDAQHLSAGGMDGGELSGRDSSFRDFAGATGLSAGTGAANDPAEEAVEALAALGYTRAEAIKAVRSAVRSLDSSEGAQKSGSAAGSGEKAEPDTETLLKAALKHL